MSIEVLTGLEAGFIPRPKVIGLFTSRDQSDWVKRSGNFYFAKCQQKHHSYACYASCVFPQCTVSQSKKYKGISLFKLPSRNCDREWKKEALRERIESGKVFICENHYQSSDIEITSMYIF